MKSPADGTPHQSRSLSHPGYVVGVDIGGTSLRLALAASTGAILSRWSVSVVGIRDPARIVEWICEGAEALCCTAGVPRSALLSVAAGAPGITDVDRGVVLVTSYLLGWTDVPLRAMLGSALHLPAAIDNDVNLATLGEGWLGVAKEIKDFVFMAIGTGVGAGIMLRGELLRGRQWIAGEIAYMLVPGASEEPGSADAPGALEAIAGGEGISRAWHADWTPELTMLPQDLRATEIFDAAVAGEPVARAALTRAARTLAYAIHNVSLVLNVPLVVLGGSVGMHSALSASIESILAKYPPHAAPRIEPSLLGTEAQLYGAVRLAIDILPSRP